MRWMWIVLIAACGSNEDASVPPPSTPATMESTMASMQASMASTGSTASTASMASMAAAPTMEPAIAAPSEPSEPTEVPEELRESHDRLVARIASNINDVPSICALASVLRRAGMYSSADSRLDDADRIAHDPLLNLELPEGTIEACVYERGRIHEAREDWKNARAAYWEAMATPIERRRRIVLEAFLRVAKREAETECEGMSTLGLRALLRLNDDPVFRRCLRQRERDQPPCEILRLDDPRHPGTRESNFDSYETVGDDGAAFGIIGDELYAISVIRGRKQVRLCDFDVPEDSRLAFARVLPLGDGTLFYVTSTNVISYTCDCEEGEEGHPESPADCRCEDAFDISWVFTDRGELRLALIADYSTKDGMQSVTWDEPHIRASISGTPSVEGDVLRLGSGLQLRSHVLVPAP